jgi:hypothetical protein
MPCTSPKARAVLKAGTARPKRNKLGLFSMQRTSVQEPHTQMLVVGIAPGSPCDGLRVLGKRARVRTLRGEAPTPVQEVVKTRRPLRRSRR